MTAGVRNPHAGEPFTDDDTAIAAALHDVSVPALLCSLVHMTGDPSWIRGDARPRVSTATDFQSAMPKEVLADVRARALPAIAAYRDGGCEPKPLARELLWEMMEFVAAAPVNEERGTMMLHDLALDGDPDAITWGRDLDEATKQAAHTVVIGAGESGLLAAIRLAQAGLPFTMVEKLDGPGGTWRHNRYPGARVDVGSHHYCYSFEPAEHWSEYFCRQPELLDYFTRTLDKYELRPHCRFNTEVTAAVWDDDAARWLVHVRDADGNDDVIDARFVISAVGALSLPRLPDIPGIDTFAGPAFHSTKWPADLDIRDKRVALVGAGATGFQIAPTIVDDVARLMIFQRTAQWMFPNPVYHAPVPEGDRWAMRHLPFYGRWFRFLMIWPGIGMGVESYRRDPEFDDSDGQAINPMSARRREALTQWITMQLDGRPDLVEKSVPPYPPMAKRILQDNGSWLGCLKKPNVDFVRTPIERIDATGIVTSDGEHYDADVLCFATGFRHVEYLAPIDFTGRGGVSLREQWGDEPTAHLGITVPNFPNLFCLYGPGTNLAHGASIIFHSECQMRLTMDAIHEVLQRGATSIEVRDDVHDEYAARYVAEIGQMVWAHGSVEHSHYKNPTGKIFTLSPWPIETYWAWTRTIDPQEYVIR
ncbi:MAG TPA: NAD(P)/FAD-dependent oxidoreductase [Acidimicrobiia bacterium]